MNKLPLCSVVLSVYNEEGNLSELYKELAKVADKEPLDWEFIFVDDGSKDKSFEILSGLHEQDERVKVLRFSRNFGAHETTAAGLANAAGEIAIIMSSDLQDPPAVIHEFLSQWRQGAKVVWGVRTARDEPWLRKVLARVFYRLLRRVLPEYPAAGTGSFCLIARPVINTFNSLSERNRVTFGLIAWSGFPHAEVPYERPRRMLGKSNWSYGRQIKSAIDTFLAFSYAPIRFISYFGIFVSVFSFLIGLIIIYYWLTDDIQVRGWASVIVGVLFLGGVQLVSLGVVGEYLWRNLEESRGRPLYIVQEKIGDFRETSTDT